MINVTSYAKFKANADEIQKNEQATGSRGDITIPGMKNSLIEKHYKIHCIFKHDMLVGRSLMTQN